MSLTVENTAIFGYNKYIKILEAKLNIMTIVRHKFKAQRCRQDGFKFASKKELKRYNELKILQQTGEVKFFQRQTPWHLPGGVKYVLDFQVKWSNGNDTYEDVKGYKTPLYLTKKKMVEAIYPIRITEI
jgi:hypothetical protein